MTKIHSGSSHGHTYGSGETEAPKKQNTHNNDTEESNNKKNKDGNEVNPGTTQPASNQNDEAFAQAFNSYAQQQLMQIYQRNKPTQLSFPKSTDPDDDGDNEEIPTTKLK